MEFKTDFGTYLPNPAMITPPPAGGSFIDGLSGVKITRLTDERDGGWFSTTYSIWSTANRDTTLIYTIDLATSTYYTAAFDPVNGARVGPLKPVAPMGAKYFINYESALWSGVDPDALFLFVDAKLYRYRPSLDVVDANRNHTGKPYELVKDLTPILGSDYSFRQQHKSADDKRFAGSGPQGFVVYDVEQDKVLLDVRTTDMNGIALDRSGKWLLYVPNDDNTEYVYNVETGAREKLVSDARTGLPDFTIGHCDVGSDFIAGDDEWRGGITARKFSSPHTVSIPFVYAPYWFSHHVCMTGADENWALLSTYRDVIGPDPNKFKNEVFQVGVQGEAAGKIRRLFHHRALANDPEFARRYWQLPRANISRDGRFVFFTSNMGGSRTDLWVADLGALNSTPTPVPVPNPPQPDPDPEPTEPPSKPPSPDGTKGATVTDNAGGVWTFGPENQTFRNGVLMDRGAGVIYKWFSGIVYLLGTDNRTWYKWANAWLEIGRDEPGGTTVPEPEPPNPDPDPIPPAPKPCSISAPASISVPRNGSGSIAVLLNDLSGPTEVKVIGSDGQVTVEPLMWVSGPTSTSKQFSVKVKNKKQVRTITFQSPCGEAVVKVNVV